MEDALRIIGALSGEAFGAWQSSLHASWMTETGQAP
jgi:hypothetical protein